MEKEMHTLPFLTEAEINELCAPLRQKSAQKRKLCAMLGLSEIPTRPDGLPIVGRKLVEERLNGNTEKISGFAWSK